MCVGKPEKVRTAPCFLSGKWHCATGEKQGEVGFSGLFFFGSFLLEEQKNRSEAELGEAK
jgi:hypothetical protein